MAGPGLEVIANIINNIPDEFQVEMVSTWNREAPLLSRIRKEQGSAASIYYTMNDGTDGAFAGLIGEGDDVNQDTEDFMDPRTELNLQRAQFRSAWSISTHELRVVRSLNVSTAADGIVKRFLDSWLEHQAALGRFLERKLVYGTGTGTSISTGSTVSDVVGLIPALSPVYTTYAGQTKSSYLGLQPTVINVGGAMAQSHFSQGFAQMNSVTGGVVPDFIMANPTTCATVIQPIADTNVRQVAALAENAPYKLGPSKFATSQVPIMSVNGIPVYQNSAWASGTVDNFGAPPIDLDGYVVAGRWQDLVWNFLPDALWGDAVGEAQDSALSGYAGVFDRLGIPTLSYARAKTGASVKFAMEGEGALKLMGLNRFIMWYGATS
jgi:hypothetical protein